MLWALIRSSVVILLLALMGCRNSSPPSAKIFLASSLMSVSGDLSAGSPVMIDKTFLSSSAIAKQIEHGAPCDLAIVADEKWRDYLIERRLVENESPTVISNRLVAATNDDRESLRDLRRELLRHEKIIIADPDYVPLGAYTKEALVNMQLYDQVKDRFVRAPSARHAVTMLTQRAASVAILYQSDAAAEKNFNVIGVIDASLHNPIRYPLLRCKNGDGARQKILEMLFSSKEFIVALKKHGFVILPLVE